MNIVPHHELLTNRRDFLRRGGAGFGALALASLMGEADLLGALGDQGGKPGSPQAAKIAHRAGKAKSVIFLFMEGGPSHIDLFDPEAAAASSSQGQSTAADSFGSVITAMGESRAPLLADKRRVEAARGKRALGERLAAAHGKAWRTTSACCGPACPTASTTPAACAQMNTGSHLRRAALAGVRG
jgi:hypothetical protein